MTPKGSARTKIREGFRAKMYIDSRGFNTIGFGTNLDAGLTERQGTALLDIQIEDNLAQLSKLAWFTALDLIRRDVIEEMTYNMGLAKVLGFHRMIAALTVHDYAGAKAEMLNSDWQTQVGARATELGEIMLTGVDP